MLKPGVECKSGRSIKEKLLEIRLALTAQLAVLELLEKEIDSLVESCQENVTVPRESHASGPQEDSKAKYRLVREKSLRSVEPSAADKEQSTVKALRPIPAAKTSKIESRSPIESTRHTDTERPKCVKSIRAMQAPSRSLPPVPLDLEKPREPVVSLPAKPFAKEIGRLLKASEMGKSESTVPKALGSFLSKSLAPIRESEVDSAA
jgi:hypothetical protein